MTDMPDRKSAVAVVLVTYESAADLPGCLASMTAAAGGHDLEVVVVDNASSDESVSLARQLGVKVLENHANLGYSRAVNLGMASTGGSWHLDANPDTRLRRGRPADRLRRTQSAQPRRH